MNLTLLFDNRQDFMEISEKNIKTLENTIKTTLELQGMEDDYEVSLSFVSNEEIKKLNKMYRDVDKETDVLSFPLFDDEEGDLIMLGDIVVSTEKIKEQAEELGHSLEREMMYLVAHSTLHLLGYDHMDEEEQEEMRQAEKEVMKKLEIFK